MSRHRKAVSDIANQVRRGASLVGRTIDDTGLFTGGSRRCNCGCGRRAYGVRWDSGKLGFVCEASILQVAGTWRFRSAVQQHPVALGDNGDIRNLLESVHGEVWTTRQMRQLFIVGTFRAPYVEAARRRDGKTGVLQFMDNPRYFFAFQPIEINS